MPRESTVQLTPEQWKLIDQYSITPTSTFLGLARMVGITTSRPDDTLQRLVKKQFNKDPQLWLSQQHEQGVAQFGQVLYEAACDKKGNPILKIFSGKNWLGMKDERTIKQPELEDKSLQVLQVMNSILSKITTKTNNPQQIESPSQRTEYTEYTPVQQDNNIVQQSNYTNIIPLQQSPNQDHIENSVKPGDELEN